MKCASFMRADTLDSALSMANRCGGSVCFLAGATDIVVKARESELYKQSHIIDLSEIDALKHISLQDGRIRIGSLVTHAQIAEDPTVRLHAGALALACASVGSPQIRNRGTIGGNLANASPAADTLAALTILRARVQLTSVAGTRTLPLEELITGSYRTQIQPGEILTEVDVDALGEDYIQDFYKLARRNALAISRLTLACAAHRAADGRVLDLRLALGSVFPTPMMFDTLTAPLLGTIPTPEKLEALAAALADKIPEIAGQRVSTQYKQPAARYITQRVLNTVLGGLEHD